MKFKNHYYKNKVITESSWSRIWQHIEDPDRSFAVISAFRDYNNEADNKKEHQKLKQEVRSMGYGFIEQDSGYSYTDKNTDTDTLVKEMSLFIPEISFEDAMYLGKKYDQESILYNSKDKGFILIFTTDGEDSEGKKHKVGDIDMTFKKQGETITFNPAILKYAYSALKKANKSQKDKKFAYVGESFKVDYINEAIPPTRTQVIHNAYKGKSTSVIWKNILGDS